MVPFTKIRIPEILDRINPDTGIYYVQYTLLSETKEKPPVIVPITKLETEDDVFNTFMPVVRHVYDDELDNIRKIDVLKKENTVEFISVFSRWMHKRINYVKTRYHIYIDASGISDKNQQLRYVQNRAYHKFRRHNDYHKEYATFFDVLRHVKRF